MDAIELFKNDTSIGNDNAELYKIHDYMRLPICLLNLVSDLLIVTIMMKNKGRNTRTNKLVMHIAIVDVFRMLDDLGLFYIMYEKILYHLPMTRLFCVFVIFEVTSLSASLALTLLLLSNTLMKSTRISDKMLISFYYGIIGLILISEILFCVFFYNNFHVFYSLSMFIFMIAVICLLIKEVNRLYKFLRKRPLSQSTAFRMNLARIYVYCWLLNYLYGPNEFMIFLSLFGYLQGFFTLLYLTCSDRNFKICLMNLLRFRNNFTDATISFADECSETMNETPDVNVSFNGTTTSLH
ncbi:PREDICTED: uncharacterized protein LOC108569940 isoform X5 [Nicrophorus vespilloides]|uniref:Uncharacterized protein LOC108569940 isoform X5 n=1 Tax=Nicrophorus vespilloides TaxID=110193 RepID=A0ABM1NK48_NICVS|nr:PREDICTED: uncharacterized protein LOC108569940 isoform X5 [Nicrophorus vespilloides]